MYSRQQHDFPLYPFPALSVFDRRRHRVANSSAFQYVLFMDETIASAGVKANYTKKNYRSRNLSYNANHTLRHNPERVYIIDYALVLCWLC